MPLVPLVCHGATERTDEPSLDASEKEEVSMTVVASVVGEVIGQGHLDAACPLAGIQRAYRYAAVLMTLGFWCEPRTVEIA